MSKRRAGHAQVRIIKATSAPEQAAGDQAESVVNKSETSTQINRSRTFSAANWISKPLPMHALKRMVSESSILPQCIRAYKSNIAGFGIGVRYKDDIEENEEAEAEYKRLEEIIELLNTDKDTKEVFEDIIEARETYGVAYAEVIRNLAGEVVQIEFIRRTDTIEKTEYLDPYMDTVYYHHGQKLVRKKRFRMYRQNTAGKTVYFKEFGDPRVMDCRDGSYKKAGEVKRKYMANEIIEFPIGTQPYGEVRWIGQLLGVDGSRRAENLNNNYFLNGRHTPMMIIVNGGSLTEESYHRLTQYMDDIKGENGQHAFMVLETENLEQHTDFEQQEKIEVEVKPLAEILQKDELFQEYLNNNRKRVQSAFLLPDLYVGYTTDFNRATAQTAMEVTEEQVFQPERKSLAWTINNKLLNGYAFKYVEAYFLAPDISNPDDLYKILTVCRAAGGLTPNKAKEIIFNALGETSEDYDGDWGNVPLDILKSSTPAVPGLPTGPSGPATGQNGPTAAGLQNITEQLDGKIEKAEGSGDNAEVVSVMKAVRKLLEDMRQKGEAE